MRVKMTTVMCVLSLCVLGGAASAQVTVERLTWAGIKLVHEDTTVLIDAVGTDLWDGNAPGGLVPVSSETGRTYALITHAHNDHFDFNTLQTVLGERGYVIAHESEAGYIASRGLRVVAAKLWTPVARGGFLFTAVPAVDGMGDGQVSWVITVDARRFFHGGDTLWHGGWSLVGQQFGPFELAFLPINAARILRDPMPESAISMNPTQAIDAALLLGAETLVPIHFGLDDPPYYVETPDALARLRREATARKLALQVMQPGDKLAP